MTDPSDLRARAARLRQKAHELTEVGRKAHATFKDGYAILVTEYDNMAIQLERMADEFQRR